MLYPTQNNRRIMDIDKVISALDSNLRREILQVLATAPRTVSETLEELNNKGLNIKYRETVYRALEKLFDADLVEKYYAKEKGLCYRLTMDRVIIDIRKGTIRE